LVTTEAAFMIPHHPGAILMCRETSSRIRSFSGFAAHRVVQQAEIDFMKSKLDLRQLRRRVMRGMTMRSMAGLGALVVLSSCVAAEKPSSEKTVVGSNQAHAGWYTQHAGRGTFQPCGQSQALQISVSADLPARARVFGLDEDTPIYVRITGAVSGGQIAVSRVDQFGSPTPVRNCAMNGVVIPSSEE